MAMLAGSASNFGLRPCSGFQTFAGNKLDQEMYRKGKLH
jgi:hypothetical protein